ncbi:MAG: hypothetical protein GX171_02225 [Clostridiales bacterium]|jgi:hypothetical protein|nr:hypothetical protein [Clostridiales bacterium]
MNKKLFSLVLALMMALALALPGLAETAAPTEDPVLASVNGVNITKSQVANQIPVFLNNQFISDETDYRAVLDVLIRRQVLSKKIADMGFDKFNQDEEDSFLAEAQAQWDNAVNSYAEYYQSADTEEAKAAARAQAEELFSSQGLTVELVAADVRNAAALDRMNDYLLAGYTPTEEEVQAVFQEIGAMYRQSFENDIAQYEYTTQYSGQSSWYTPEGYRGIIHILLKADEALVQNYQTLSAAFEEQQQTAEVPVEPVEGEETAPPEPAKEAITQQMVDEARQAVLDSRKADIDMIYERLGRGESFLDLIKEYGEDPGMTVENNIANGYSVHSQSIIYDPVFTRAAFSEKMQQSGDVSDPVVGSFGIHILQYLRDVPSGLIMTEAIRLEIEDYLRSMKENQAYEAAFEGWLAQETVVYYDEAIDQAIAQAQEHAQSPLEQPLEALPETEETVDVP